MTEADARQARRVVLTAFGITAALLLGILTSIAAYSVRHNFTPAKWQDNREARYQITRSLESRYTLVGMTEDEITALLGPEDSQITSFKLSRKTYPDETTLVYYLGVDYIDCNWLILSLENGVCTEIHYDVT